MIRQVIPRPIAVVPAVLAVSCLAGYACGDELIGGVVVAFGIFAAAQLVILVD